MDEPLQARGEVLQWRLPSDDKPTALFFSDPDCDDGDNDDGVDLIMLLVVVMILMIMVVVAILMMMVQKR